MGLPAAPLAAASIVPSVLGNVISEPGIRGFGGSGGNGGGGNIIVNVQNNGPQTTAKATTRQQGNDSIIDLPHLSV